MTATFADFLACSVDCSNSTATHEGPLRAAVSRAYYAAMHNCLDWEKTQLPIPGHAPPHLHGTHNVLCARLANPDSTVPQPLKVRSKQRAYALRAFHAVRVVADYHLQESITMTDAQQAIADANRVIGL